ncbi:hypothetical protein, partial [Mesorhizobium sp. M1A.F.Ca.IN.020.06.1.1]|uniref:hypothetical protein n=1 Tax=Mesorhizobium sp. M1A.F.Ca.IN.020.06.1.1 TaxID=2496765 RepID=UPI0019D4224C
VGPVAISNHEDVQIEPFGSTLKSREQRGCHILLFEYQLLAVLADEVSRSGQRASVHLSYTNRQHKLNRTVRFYQSRERIGPPG